MGRIPPGFFSKPENRFVLYMRELSLVLGLSRLDETDMVVMDSRVLNRFEQEQGRLKCLAVDPSQLGRVPDDVKRVLVFTAGGQMGLVRRLKAQYPKKRIVSGIYEFAVSGIGNRPVMRAMPVAPQGAETKPPLVVLCSAYADGEYLGRLMGDAGLPQPIEYIGRPFAYWAALDPSLQLTRLYDAVRTRFMEDGRMAILVQGDVLEAFMQHTSLTWQRLERFLTQAGAHVVHLRRADKLMQAGVGMALEASEYRSLWTIPEGSRKTKIRRNFHFGHTFKMMQAQIRQERAIEEMVSQLEGTLSFSLEELVAAPQKHLEQIGQLIGEPVQAVPAVPYSHAFERQKSMLADARSFRYEIIDRMGVHQDPILT